MRGLKLMLLGFQFILIAGFFIASSSASLGGVGEWLLMVLGVIFGVMGLNHKD